MKIKKITSALTIGSLLAYLFSIIFLKLEYSNIDELFLENIRLIRYIAIGLLILNILIDIIVLKEFTKRQLIVAGILLVYIIVLNYVFNFYPLYLVQNQILVYFLMEVAFKNIDYRKTMKIVFCFLLSYLIVIIMLTMLNVLRFHAPGWGIDTNRMRLIVGMHPNTFSYIYLFLVFIYIYLRNIKLEKYEFVMLIAVSIVQYYVYTSRSVFWFSIAFIVSSYFINNSKFIRKIYIRNKMIFCILPLVLALLSFVLAINYDSNVLWQKQINHVLSGRLSLANQHLNDVGLTLFGTNFNKLLYLTERGFDDFDNAVYVDMSFVACYVRFGLITLLMYIGSLSFFSYIICKKRDILMLNVFLFALLFTFFNDTLFMIEESFFLLIWSYYNSQIKYCYNNNYEAIY